MSSTIEFDNNVARHVERHNSTNNQKISDELLRMANSLSNFAKKINQEQQHNTNKKTEIIENSYILEPNLDKKTIRKMASKLYAERRSREKIFDVPSLFGEPAWDILLDLTVAYTSDKSISVTSASIGSSAPLTTALRWLSILEDNGLVEREDDNFDKRRAFVKLSEKGYAKMVEYLAANYPQMATSL